MAYIGRTPSSGAFETQTLTADSSTTTFSLDYTVGSTSSVLVSVAGVVQQPNTGYALTGGGSSIVFSAAPTSGDPVFVIFLGIARDVADFLSTGVITTQTELAEVAADDDFLLIYDTSATSLKKIQKSNFDTSLDITGKTELAEQAADDDELVIYDTSAGSIKKIQKSNLDTSLDINGKTDLTTGLQGADELVIYDNSATAIKKVNLDNLVTGQTEVTSLQDSDVFLVYDNDAGSLKKVEKQYVATSTLTYTNGSDTGDGSTQAFTIDSGRTVNDVLVHVNGFLLTPTDDYTISGTTLTIATAPAASAEVSIRYLPLTGSATYTNDTATGDGSTQAFTIDSGRSVEDVLVSVNGVTLVPTTDYTISGTTLTFTTAPASSAEISIRYLRLT